LELLTEPFYSCIPPYAALKKARIFFGSMVYSSCFYLYIYCLFPFEFCCWEPTGFNFSCFPCPFVEWYKTKNNMAPSICTACCWTYLVFCTKMHGGYIYITGNGLITEDEWRILIDLMIDHGINSDDCSNSWPISFSMHAMQHIK
jgi:hypothetical protein